VLFLPEDIGMGPDDELVFNGDVPLRRLSAGPPVWNKWCAARFYY